MNPNLLESKTTFARVIDWIRDHTVGRDDLTLFCSSDLQAMAHDLGVAEADLLDVLPRGHDNSLLMDQMIRARGLDPAQLRRSFGLLVRDLEITCTRCGNVARCRHELAAGTAADDCHEFCGNAETFDELIASDKSVPHPS